ncbi:MAG: peroxiredoxin family protein [Deltaproteobacteria bacterium]
MRKSLVVVLCVSFLGALTAPGFASAAVRSPSTVDRTDAAPDFRLQSVGGRSVALSDYRGKGVVLFFFTTWCPYCMQKFPLLEKKSAELEEAGVVLLPIDVGESRDKVASFREKRKVDLDILLDTAMSAARDYGVLGVPTFFLVNADGAVVYDGNDLPGNYKEIFEKG